MPTDGTKVGCIDCGHPGANMIALLDMLLPEEIPSETAVSRWTAAHPKLSLNGPAGRQPATNLELADKIGSLLAAPPFSERAGAVLEHRRDDMAHDQYLRIRRVAEDPSAAFVRTMLSAWHVFVRKIGAVPTSTRLIGVDRIDSGFADLISALFRRQLRDARYVTNWQTREISRDAMARWIRGRQIFAALTQGLIGSFRALGHAMRAGEAGAIRQWADLCISSGSLQPHASDSCFPTLTIYGIKSMRRRNFATTNGGTAELCLLYLD